MRLLLLIALLSPALAFAQTQERETSIATPSSRPSLGVRVLPKLQSAPTVSYPADITITFPNAIGGTISSSAGTSFTYTRGGTGPYCPTASGYQQTSANQPCTYNGRLISEASSDNYVKWSEALNNATWTATTTTVTQHASITWRSGGSLMWTVNTTDATDGGIRETTAMGANFFTLSGYARAATGTAAGSLALLCAATPAACTCYRESGGACTADTTGNYCRASATFGTTVDRMQLNATCPSFTSSPEIVVAGGVFKSSTGSILWTGIQAEQTKAATLYMPGLSGGSVRSTDTLTTSTTSDYPSTTGAVGIDYEPYWNGTAPTTNGSAAIGTTYNAASYASQGGWTLSITNLGQLSWQWSGTGISYTQKTNALTWAAGTRYYIRVTLNNGVVKLFRDGTEYTITSTSGTSAVSSTFGPIHQLSGVGTSTQRAFGWLGPRYCVSKNPNGCPGP